MVDPYAVLGVGRDADAAAIHAAYRKAVRRTHPDAGGTAAEFEAVQDAYETLRVPARRAVHDARSAPPPPRPTRPPPRRSPGPEGEFDRRPMEDLLAESHRLENEARRLAGLGPRDFREAEATPEGEAGDSFAAILDDAGRQLRDVASATAREVGRRVRRML